MIKYFIVQIKWDILNNGRIGRILYTPKSGYNGESPLYTCIDYIWDLYVMIYFLLFIMLETINITERLIIFLFNLFTKELLVEVNIYLKFIFKL